MKTHLFRVLRETEVEKIAGEFVLDVDRICYLAQGCSFSTLISYWILIT
jgi:hypothetical protein